MVKDPLHGSKQGDVLDSQEPFSFASSLDLLHPESEGYTLFGSGGAQDVDVFQGVLGDCWFMHA